VRYGRVIVDDELRRLFKELVMAFFRYCSDIYMEKLRIIMGNL
jgi:hypothetical protein